MWLLADNLKKLQASEYERYEQELTHYEKLSEQERKNERQPAPPRGYYVSNATIEGLYTDLSNHPTGGLIMLLNEISSLLTAQGQYKGGKGSDRESWLELWDGSPVRTVRSGGSGFIKDARVQVVGGTHPGTFSKIFNSEGGIYLSDGTVFRGLYTYEPTGHFEVTDETWKAEERAPWERVYKTALKWAESRNRETLPLRLSPAAWQLFKTWRNECDIAKLELPLMLRGFIPKSFSYILRIAGVLHCLESFSTNSAPSENINDATLRAGIDIMEFYLGQAVDAVRLLSDGKTAPPVEMSERTSLLARTFEGLRNQTDNGRLAVGFIQEQFNMLAPAEERIETSRAMGRVLRGFGLTVSAGKHHANERNGVRCLCWDEKTDLFIRQRPQSPRSQFLQDVEDEDLTGAKSSTSSDERTCVRTLRTLEAQHLQPQTIAGQRLEDIEDVEDIILGANGTSPKESIGFGKNDWTVPANNDSS